eukprot:428697_1
MTAELQESLLQATYDVTDKEQQSVELTTIDSRNIILNTVRQNHIDLMDNNQSIDTAIVELVNILGGIDVLLQQLLSPSNCSQLTNDELSQINGVLASFSNNKVTELTEVSNDWDDIQSVISVKMVDERNTFLHRVCCKKYKPVADELVNYLFGKYLIWCWGFLMITLVVITTIDYIIGSISTFVMLFKDLFTVILTLPFCIIWVLSLNISVTKQIMKKFEFWFKFFYFMRYWICSSVIYNNHKTAQEIAGNIFVDITLFLLYIIYCFMDGLKLSSTFKVFVLVSGSIYMTVLAIYWTFLIDKTENISIYTLNIDLKILTATSLRTVVVFMWKQTVLSWLKPNSSTYFKQPISINYERRNTIGNQ